MEGIIDQVSTTGLSVALGTEMNDYPTKIISKFCKLLIVLIQSTKLFTDFVYPNYLTAIFRGNSLKHFCFNQILFQIK
jgi:hypothetical protein